MEREKTPRMGSPPMLVSRDKPTDADAVIRLAGVNNNAPGNSESPIVICAKQRSIKVIYQCVRHCSYRDPYHMP